MLLEKFAERASTLKFFRYSCFLFVYMYALV